MSEQGQVLVTENTELNSKLKPPVQGRIDVEFFTSLKRSKGKW
jgi:hypothetical protein